MVITMCEKLNDPCKGVEWGDVCLNCTMRDEVSATILAIQKEMAKKRWAQNNPRKLDKKVLESFKKHDGNQTSMDDW